MSSRYQDSAMSCKDYLLLNPEKASLFDLIRLLVSEDLIEGKDFLERPQGLAAADEHLKRLKYRWIVFVSVVFQKIFILLKNPVAAFGSSLRDWLTCVFVNGGLLKYLFNKTRGNLVRLEESWDEGRSVAGYTDVRDDLDKSIKPDGDDERYVVHLSLMASKLSYENSTYVAHVVTNKWQMEFLHFYSFWNAFLGELTTQAFVFQTSSEDPDLVVVSFRGTEPFNLIDWCTDVDISWYGIEGVGKLHGGFMKALGLSKNMGWPKEPNNSNTDGPSAYYMLRQILREKTRENGKTKFILTGHSLGGALAILFAGMLFVHDETEILRRVRGVYTFGQPRVGDAEFGQYMVEKLKAHNVTYRRFVYCNDVVPRLPYDDKLFFFKHFGECLFFDSLYKGEVLKEEPNRNYFSLFWAVPKYLTAYWELIRGQTMLPLTRGRLYGEWFGLVLYRLIGLVIPGLAAHGPQDYDNITRLGNTGLQPGMDNTLKID